MSDFKKALAFVLKWEGGYSNNPNDSGGPTMRGIIQVVYNSYRKSQGLKTQPVKKITQAEVEAIYKTLYWEPSLAAKLTNSNLALVQFDTAVNCGVSRAKSFLKLACKFSIDIELDTKIITKINSWNQNQLIERYLEIREKFYYRISKGKNKVFLKGWLNRLGDLKKVTTI